jgi:DNA polymerase I-like protein with 3'-5' exonuclease and polymerase domains
MGLAGGFGYEARSLFDATPEEGLPELTGTDMSSLEFVLLGHDLYPYDGGEFSRRACDPKADLHADHASRASLSRAHAKTLGYLIIYGGGAHKAGLGMGVEEQEIPQLLLDKGLPNRLRFMRKLLGSDYEEPSDLDKARIVKGARGIKSIKEAIPGLGDLINDIKIKAEERGWVLDIAGAKLHVRKAHAALNTRLQGSGAVACKLWIVLFHRKMQERGYQLGVHYNQVLWVHDEKQNEHQKGLGKIIAEVSEEAAKEAGVMLGLRGEFRTESKTGTNWAETH